MAFENFPYTNFHEINLDWIVAKVKEAYSASNPPDYPVKSVNGMTGDVIIAIPANLVSSVNGETGDVVLYRNPLTQFPATDEQRWNLFRICDGTETGIEFDEDSTKRIAGTRRILIYDEDNPPDYPVTSVNGQTGDVQITARVQSVNGKTGNVITPFLNPNTDILSIDTASPSILWGFSRNVAGGNVALYITSGGGSPKAFIRYIPDGGNAINLPLLTNADIPENAGVVSVNTKSGVVTLYGTDMLTTENGNTIAQDIDDLKIALYKKSDITWERILGSAVGVFDSANAACTPILETLGSVIIRDNAKAVIYLYSGQTYLGKMNSRYVLDTSPQNWGYYTGSVDIGKIIRDNYATGARIGIVPTDETIISDETVQTWGNNHCDVYLYKFETVSDASIIKSTVNKHDQQITALQTSDTAQGQAISALQAADTAKGQQISALQTSDTAQGQAISALQAADTAKGQQISALQSSQTTQDQQISELYTRTGVYGIFIENVNSLPLRYPASGTDPKIKNTNMVVGMDLYVSGVQVDAWTITTYDGYLEITGTMNGTSSMTLYLA